MDIDKLLIVDIRSVPEGLDVNVWIDLIEKSHLVLYDGALGGNKPETKSDSYRIVNIRELSKEQREDLVREINIEI